MPSYEIRQMYTYYEIHKVYVEYKDNLQQLTLKLFAQRLEPLSNLFLHKTVNILFVGCGCSLFTHFMARRSSSLNLRSPGLPGLITPALLRV